MSIKNWIRPRLEAAREMPELRHFVGKESGVGFEISKSEVVTWLFRSEPVAAWLVDCLRRRGIIRYDAARNLWVGVSKIEAYDEAMRNPKPMMGRTPKHEDEVVLDSFTETRHEIEGLREWHRMRGDLEVSYSTFQRMVGRMLKAGRVTLEKRPARGVGFPQVIIYRLPETTAPAPDGKVEA